MREFPEIEPELDRQLSSLSRGLAVDAAARYMVFPGGKRIRPRLALSVCADLSGDTSAALPAAISLEFLHISTLIHDDLPDLDNDDFRRGRETCHKKFGAATAILAGDLLVAASFRSLAACALPIAQRQHLLELLAGAYGDICQGQDLDLHVKEPQAEQIHLCHLLKTASLFAASVGVGAVAGGLQGAVLSRLLEWGREFGMLFQFLDDVIDRFGSLETRGRPLSSDFRNQKQTMAKEQEGSALESKLYEAIANTQLKLSQIGGELGRPFIFTNEVIKSVAERNPFTQASLKKDSI